MSLNAKGYLDEINRRLGGEFLSHVCCEDSSVAKIQSAYAATGLYTKEQTHELDSLRGKSVASLISENVMKPMATDLQNEFVKHGFPLRQGPTIGVLPTLDFNACAMRAPNGDDICVMDHLLYATLASIARAVTECVFAGVQQKEGNYEAAFRSLLGVLLWFSGKRYQEVSGLVQQYHQLGADPMRVYAAGQLATQVMVFIMSHEFAHHALGHIGVPTPLRLHSKTVAADVKVYNRSQLDEFAADELGFRVFLSCSATSVEGGSRRYFTQGDISPLLFFHFLDIYERVILGLDAAPATSSTHPPAWARLQRIAQSFTEWAHEDSRIAYPYVRDFFTDFREYASKVAK